MAKPPNDPEELPRLRHKLDTAKRVERIYGRPVKSVTSVDGKTTVVRFARPARGGRRFRCFRAESDQCL